MLKKGIKSKAATLLIGLLLTLLGVMGFGTVAYGQQREQRRPEWIERDIREEQQREQQERRMSRAEREDLQRERQERTDRIHRELQERHDQQVRERQQREQQTQQREQRRPEWIERDIREEQQRERYESGLPTWQRRELEQERQERTNRIPRELQERREQLLRERNDPWNGIASGHWNAEQRDRQNSETLRQARERQLRELDSQTVRVQPFGIIVSSYFDYRPLSQYGHQYDAWNLLDNAQALGAMGLTTEEQVYSKMTSRGITALIRSEPANPNDDGSIAVGKRFILYHYIDVVGRRPAPVEVIEVSGRSFTVKTLPGHPLQGTVKHEVVKDANGNFWLHQHGTGVFNEPAQLQATTYYYAPSMWNNMRANAMRVLRRQ
jgi:hypothetical protein